MVERRTQCATVVIWNKIVRLPLANLHKLFEAEVFSVPPFKIPTISSVISPTIVQNKIMNKYEN